MRRGTYRRTVLLIDEEPSVCNLFVLSMPVDQVRLMTADDGAEMLMNVINHGEIYRFIVKPWDIGQVTALVLEGLARYEQ